MTLLTHLAIAAIYILIGVVGTLLVQTVRRDAAAARAEREATEAEFTDLLARAREFGASLKSQPSWSPPVWLRFGAKRGAVRPKRMYPVPPKLERRPRVEWPVLDRKLPRYQWPVNYTEPIKPVKPVGRVAYERVDFSGWVRDQNRRIRERAAGLQDTGVIQRVEEPVA